MDVLAEEATTKLSIAVQLKDEYLGRPVGNPEVSLKGHDVRPAKNLGGYYVFFDLPEGGYTVQVKGGEYYFDEEVNAATVDRLVSITLTPTPRYPFPPSATLVRGSVKNSNDEGIPGAIVKVNDKNVQTRTTETGEFVVWFKDLRKKDVKTVEGRKLVKIGDAGDDPVLEIEHPKYLDESGKPLIKTQPVEVEEGHTTSLSIPYP